MIVAAGGGPENVIVPKLTAVETPPRFTAKLDASRVKSASILFKCPTSASLDPLIETPRVTDPAGIIVSRLSCTSIRDLRIASMICVARMAPSISLAYDFTATTFLAKIESDARSCSCFAVNRRGAITASSCKFCEVNSAVSCFNCPISPSFLLRSNDNLASFALLNSSDERIYARLDRLTPIAVINRQRPANPAKAIDFKFQVSQQSARILRSLFSVVRRCISGSIELFEDTFTSSDFILIILLVSGEAVIIVMAHRAIKEIKRR